ncbi:MAG: Isocitrate dehydrogenase [NADP] (EC; Monomeric isocitrate dehydrogenase [NADP] (EC [uncultured Thiotrichaceae bacterium]|uniref:Isocitrate dehydrogenase [NADP] n=1 Tax=uncultured Thiotrichaceae bacterium TaxID=298394 RepID=A0A6S6TW61_9GAMM|nr:MAG: Isocitrate dehydrogenase [NADP] (EC; Monomeric isocitrate dehydrogenase [NADP] (EC [uncultured Thiotrichaceae bacterium]
MTSSKNQTITYTLTDESPLLATYSLLPILRTFFSAAGIPLEKKDISLPARILGEFSDVLNEDQQMGDALAELGAMVKASDTNIIKLPNISASIPQLKSAITELQNRGFNIPDYPEAPDNDEDQLIHDRYTKVTGSAVNPVLRQGNSDRRVPRAVKKYAQNNPHEMSKWSAASRTHVAHMRHGDFYSSEKCMTMEKPCEVSMELLTEKKKKNIVLKKNIPLLEGEIIDSMFMSKEALVDFIKEQLRDSKKTGVMFSFHVKATMMRVSHPIVFGHAVKIFYRDLFKRHRKLFKKLGVNPNNGISSVYEKIAPLPRSRRKEIEFDIQACYSKRAELAMVDPTEVITNLHSPNDVIVDASMPAMIRNGGKMRSPAGRLKDVKAVMPESTYARIYQEMINFCKTNGAFDPATMGSVPNVGLMAQKAEEYGSHDKTFEIPEDGLARIVDAEGNILLEQEVEKGDIWRMCQTKDEPVHDWVKLAVRRARETGLPTVFWLDHYRPHDQQLIKKIKAYLAEMDLTDTDIQIMSPLRAMRFSLERIIRAKDTISVTGNILRDYLTDLFPIMEVGTSSKMLSIVPMIAGGSMFETGAGGTAPVLVKQILEENHLCWDSLGEFLAIAASLEEYSRKTNNPQAQVLGTALEDATARVLKNHKSPSPRTGEMDTRGSHFYLAMYWAEELAKQESHPELAEHFKKLAKTLNDNEKQIMKEMTRSFKETADLGGYYFPDADKMRALMRPSETFNSAIQEATIA